VSKLRTALVAVSLFAALVAIPVALGSSSGANAGYTYSPASNAANCTKCHDFDPGQGTVELFGAPRRYLPGMTYDLTVRVHDDERVASGFEISVERALGFAGNLIVNDAVNTQLADRLPTYITHTAAAYDDSLATWAANGNAYEYHLQWQAPSDDQGLVTFYVSAQASNDAQAIQGEHYYHTHAISQFAKAADADGDTDVDLYDYAVLENCFGIDTGLPEACAFMDDDGNGAIDAVDYAGLASLYTGPTATEPAGYVLADVVRGGRLYDNWWSEAGVSEPSTDHPLWASRPDQASDTSTGSATWRCTECHGWDYQGMSGVYGSGPHHTGFPGIFGSTLTSQQVFDLLRDPTGHAYTLADTGLTDNDIWDLVKFVRSGQFDDATAIDETGAFTGSSGTGSYWYSSACFYCHGDDGKLLNFGTQNDPSYLGTVANNDPWQLLHKMRFGHPGSMMEGTELLRWDSSRAVDIGTYTQTLPTQ